MDPANMPAKFEVRSFTSAWDNGVPKKIRGVGVGNGAYIPKERCWDSMNALHTDYSSISSRLPEILDDSFECGSRSPTLGEEEAVGGRGRYRSKERLVGPTFLSALRSNFLSIFTRFRDNATFVLQDSTFHHPTSI